METVCLPGWAFWTILSALLLLPRLGHEQHSHKWAVACQICGADTPALPVVQPHIPMDGPCPCSSKEEDRRVLEATTPLLASLTQRATQLMFMGQRLWIRFCPRRGEVIEARTPAQRLQVLKRKRAEEGGVWGLERSGRASCRWSYLRDMAMRTSRDQCFRQWEEPRQKV
jgi:hypothetical protein